MDLLLGSQNPSLPLASPTVTLKLFNSASTTRLSHSSLVAPSQRSLSVMNSISSPSVWEISLFPRKKSK